MIGSLTCLYSARFFETLITHSKFSVPMGRVLDIEIPLPRQFLGALAADQVCGMVWYIGCRWRSGETACISGPQGGFLHGVEVM